MSLFASLVLSYTLAFDTDLIRSVAPTCAVRRFEDLPSAMESCTTIVLSGIRVPGGQTLALTKLKRGSKIIFDGRTVRMLATDNEYMIHCS